VVGSGGSSGVESGVAGVSVAWSEFGSGEVEVVGAVECVLGVPVKAPVGSRASS
jgi:hypothetical protein